MTESDFARKIEVKDLLKKRTEEAEIARRLSSDIEKKFFGPKTLQVIGKIFMGAPTKIDGSQWTLADLDQAWDKMILQQEEGTRRHLARDMMLAIEAQTQFFQEAEHPMKKASDTNIELAVALMERVLASGEKITERFALNEGETPREAMALELLRRKILRPTYILVEIPKLDEEFMEEREELITDKMKAVVTRDTNEYFRLEDERIRQGLESRSEQEWTGILEEESSELTDYLKLCLVRNINERKDSLQFLSRLRHKGKRLLPVETENEWKKGIEDLEEMQQELSKVNDTQGALAWIKGRFGDGASFRSFLQYLNPIDELEPEQSQESIS